MERVCLAHGNTVSYSELIDYRQRAGVLTGWRIIRLVPCTRQMRQTTRWLKWEVFMSKLGHFAFGVS